MGATLESMVKDSARRGEAILYVPSLINLLPFPPHVKDELQRFVAEIAEQRGVGRGTSSPRPLAASQSDLNAMCACGHRRRFHEGSKRLLCVMAACSRCNGFVEVPEEAA